MKTRCTNRYTTRPEMAPCIFILAHAEDLIKVYAAIYLVAVQRLAKSVIFGPVRSARTVVDVRIVSIAF